MIHCTGRLFAHLNTTNVSNASDSENPEENIEREPGISLVVVASPVPHPSNIEVPLGKYTFLSKHNLNMKFTYADDKLVYLHVPYALSTLWMAKVIPIKVVLQ